jgi:hypothetical protein
VFLLTAVAIDLSSGRWAFALLLCLAIGAAGLSGLHKSRTGGEGSRRGSGDRGAPAHEGRARGDA